MGKGIRVSSLAAPSHIESFSHIYAILRHSFGLDVRSLALFRFCLGLTVFGDAIDRVRDIQAHYSDFGIVPRSVILQSFYSPNSHHFSPFFLSGTTFGVGILFLILMSSALSLALGYRTTVSSILTWIMFNSLLERNNFVSHGGDVLLRLLLFWSMFLPLGKRWSVDRALLGKLDQKPKQKKEEKNVLLNMATFSLMMQVSFMYLFAHISKSGDTWRVNGHATFYALTLNYFQRPLALFYLNFLSLIQMLSFGVLYWQGYGWLFNILPFWQPYARYLGVLGFLFMHFNLGLALHLGTFFPACITANIPFIPEHFWNNIFLPFMDKIAPCDKESRSSHPKIVYLSGCKWCKSFIHIICTFFLTDSEKIRHIHYDQLQRESKVVEPTSGESSSEINPRALPHKTYGWATIDHVGNVFFGAKGLMVLLSYSPVYLLLSNLWNRLSMWREKFESFLDIIIEKCLHGEKHTVVNPLTPKDCNEKIRVLDTNAVNRSISPLINLGEKFEKHATSDAKRNKRIRHFLGNIIALFFIIFVLKYNYQAHGCTKYPFLNHNSYWVAETFYLSQFWGMFAPNPPNVEWWFSFELILADTSHVELFREGGLYSFEPSSEGVVFDAPKNIHVAMKNHRWVKYFEHGMLNSNNNRQLLPILTTYLCRGWNSRPGRQANGAKISEIKIWYIWAKREYPNPALIVNSTTKHLLWHRSSGPWDC